MARSADSAWRDQRLRVPSGWAGNAVASGPNAQPRTGPVHSFLVSAAVVAVADRYSITRFCWSTGRGRIKYQLVVVFMQAAATAIAAMLFVRLAVARYLTPPHQFTRSRL